MSGHFESEDGLMHKIGDKVVYASYGVMEIVDIRDEIVMDGSHRYYILEAPSSRSGSQTFVPVENETLVSKMRPLLSKESVLEIISEIDSVIPADWTNDNRARSEKFKAIIESGDHIKMIAMIKLIENTGKQREEEGKKNYLVDEDAKAKAQRLIYSEFAAVLGIDEADVPEFIRKNK